MNMLVIGENIIDGKLVIIEVRDDGTARATFPNWAGEDLRPTYFEVTTLALLVALLPGVLAQHP
jgi:hypothetical protein